MLHPIFFPASTASSPSISSKNRMPSASWLSCFASASIFVARNPVTSSTWFGSFVHPSQMSYTSWTRARPEVLGKKCGFPLPGYDASSATNPAVRWSEWL